MISKMSRIQDLRIKKGLSQSQLAKAADMNYRVLQDYEIRHKKIEGAKLKTLINLANALNCQIYELLEDEELKRLMQDYEESIVNE